MVDVFFVEEVVIQDVGPNVIEAFHILIVAFAEVEFDTVISKEGLWDILHGIALKVEKDAESVQNKTFLSHLP